MKIALISCFNEVDSIEKAINSIYDYVDEIHVWDGAYKHYPHNVPYSTDGTLELIEKLAKKKKKIKLWKTDTAYDHQIAKRTAMFSSGGEGDYFLILDADEYIVNPQDLKWTGDVVYAYTRSHLYDEPYTTPRVIKWRQGLHYGGRHSWIYDGENNFVASHQHTTPRIAHSIQDVYIYNLRKQERERNKQVFRGLRNLSEGKFHTENIYRKAEVLKPLEGRANRTGKGFETIFNNKKKPLYSLIVPFSRPWAVGRWFKHFKSVEMPKDGDTELLIIVDTANPRFYNQVQAEALKLQRFCRIKTLMTKVNAIQETSQGRRARILSHMYKFQCEIRGEYVLGAEDDTLPDLDAYPKLLKTLKEKKAGFVQGTELGRWGAYQCVPHWTITDTEVKTAAYMGQDLVEIDGGGWYCFVCPSDVFRLPKVRKSNDPPLGPDLCFVWDIKQAGYSCWGDWSINCIHFTEKQDFHPLTTPAMQFGQRLVSNSPQRYWREFKNRRIKSKYNTPETLTKPVQKKRVVSRKKRL